MDIHRNSFEQSSRWSDALYKWMNQYYNIKIFGEPSWRTLLTAVAEVDGLLFKRLAKNHQGEITFRFILKLLFNTQAAVADEAVNNF